MAIDLNARELALLIWSGLLVVVLLFSPSTRSNLWGVIKSFFAAKLSRIYALALLYVLATVWMLHLCGLWSDDQIKNTIIWFAGAAIPALFKADAIEWNSAYVKTLFLEIVKFIAFTEFLINLYPFSLSVELLLVPLMVFLALLLAVSDRDKKNEKAKNCLTNLAAIVGLGLLAYSALSITLFGTLFNRKWHEHSHRNACRELEKSSE